MKPTEVKKIFYLFAATALTAALLTTSASAQPAAPAPARSADAKGLDALNDDALMSELASDGLETLLKRAFDLNKVPEDKQKGILVVIRLKQLADPKTLMTYRQRSDLVKGVVADIQKALPNLKDPKALMEYASYLIKYGVDRDVNTIEYWGPTDKAKAELRPTVQAVLEILDKCKIEADASANKAAAGITGGGQAAMNLWQSFDNLANNAEYTKHMSEYYLVLSMDASDKRKEVAGAAIDYLKQYDNADSQVQPIVRNRIAKLTMAEGEYEDAKKLFEPIANKGADIKPAPDLSQQYEAQYFMAQCDLLAKNVDAAKKALDNLLKWQEANLPKDESDQSKATREGAEAAADMLRYRILNLESAQAKAANKAKEAAEALTRANNVLLELVKKQPGLSGIIYDQLMANLPDNPDLSAMDTLMLKAMIDKGDQAREKEKIDDDDKKTIERAIAAAKEVLSRKGKPGVSPEIVQGAAIRIPFDLDKIDKDVDAANAFLDYLDEYPTGQFKQIAFDNAGALVFQLRDPKSDLKETPEVNKLFDRFLPVAILKFNHKEFAFQYAWQLQKTKHYKEAAGYYAQVPQNNPAILEARFFQMIALKQSIDEDEKMDPGQRAKVLANVQTLAEFVRQNATARIAQATTDEKKKNYKSMLVKTTLLAADVAKRDQKDPKKTLELLNGFEEDAKGLDGEDGLLSEALFLRVNSFMELNKNDEATATLLPLLAKDPTKGADLVYGLLKRLDDDLEKARHAGDSARMRQLADARAHLSGHLVDWARNSPDPKIKAYTYSYMVFDAATHQLAAELQEDKDTKTKQLKETLDLYKALQSPENAKLYADTLKEKNDKIADTKKKINPKDPDPQVLVGIAKVAYSLGDYKSAQQGFSKLLEDRKLGSPQIEEQVAPGQTRLIDNDQYWEALMKLLDSNYQIAKADNDQKLLDGIKRKLAQLYATWGDHTGGARYDTLAESLRKELLPDVKPTKFEQPSTQPAEPSTQSAEAKEPASLAK